MAETRSDWSTFLPSLVVTLIGSVLAGGLVAIGVAWFSAQLQQSFAEQAAATATCENPQRLHLASSITADASDALSYTAANGEERSFPAENLVDGDRTTAWVGAEADGGVGTVITLALPTVTDVRMVCVLNGFARTSDLYDANGSARVLTVDSGNGVRHAVLPRLNDENVFAYQQLAIAPGPTQRLVLTVQASDVPEESALGPVSVSITEIEVWVDVDE